MSRIIASAAIRGAHRIANRAEAGLAKALDTYGGARIIEFPNTAYFLPVIHGMTGMVVRKLEDMLPVMKRIKTLLPPVPAEKLWLPYLGHTLDAGMATLFADEVIESLKYIEKPPYNLGENCPEGGMDFWLGAADDVIMRKRGIEFVDGTAPGFAACVGACPTNEIAVKIARELQEKNLYIFMVGETGGRSMAEQLRESDVQMGWETRLVPFGKEITSAVFALGFATRAALAFGGVKPGDFKRILLYNKNRIFAFVLAMGEVDDEKYAQAAGAINFGFPVIADTPIPQILPTGVCTYEHVVSSIPYDQMVQKAIEVRGLKVVITKIPIPVSFGPAFEGERIRAEDMQLEMGGQKTPGFEYVTSKPMNEVQDGKIEVIGKDIDGFAVGTGSPVGIVVEVAGRQMQADFEPILERQLHRLLNCAQGVFHMGQRDINWIRVGKEAYAKGFRLGHFGTIIHAKYHAEFGAIVDKVQVKIYTDKADVLRLRENARAAYNLRDERIGALTDEAVDTFYSCTLCQSFAPNHICVITPERAGLCGAYNWLDGKAAFQINPRGPNQPIKKGDVIDPVKGQWTGVNEFVFQASRKTLTEFNAYSIMVNPMTSCGCFECVSVIQPLANGVMVVNREFPGMTPCGMKFSTLAGSVGGGLQTPGFVGHSKRYIVSKKYLSAEGGLARVVWLPKQLKEELRPLVGPRLKELGMENFLDLVADETIAMTEEQVMEHCAKAGHPALKMDPLM